jgi:hypothetical protein
MIMEDPTNFVKPEELERHHKGRIEDGFSVFDFWNFNTYLSWVIIGGLEKFKDGAGHPANLEDMAEWREALEVMIDGFKAQEELNSMESWDRSIMTYKEFSGPLEEKWRKGAALFVEYYGSLWD